MMRKILYIVVFGPIALIVIALSIANRQLIAFSFDPLDGDDPALTLRLPLFALVLVSILIGILAGGFAAWVRQGKWRKAARANAHEMARWQREVRELRRQLDESAPRALPGASADPPPS